MVHDAPCARGSRVNNDQPDTAPAKLATNNKTLATSNKRKTPPAANHPSISRPHYFSDVPDASIGAGPPGQCRISTGRAPHTRTFQKFSDIARPWRPITRLWQLRTSASHRQRVNQSLHVATTHRGSIMKSFTRTALLGAAGLVLLTLPALAQRPYDPSAGSVGFKHARPYDASAGSVGFKKSRRPSVPTIPAPAASASRSRRRRRRRSKDRPERRGLPGRDRGRAWGNWIAAPGSFFLCVDISAMNSSAIVTAG